MAGLITLLGVIGLVASLGLPSPKQEHPRALIGATAALVMWLGAIIVSSAWGIWIAVGISSLGLCASAGVVGWLLRQDGIEDEEPGGGDGGIKIDWDEFDRRRGGWRPKRPGGGGADASREKVGV